MPTVTIGVQTVLTVPITGTTGYAFGIGWVIALATTKIAGVYSGPVIGNLNNPNGVTISYTLPSPIVGGDSFPVTLTLPPGWTPHANYALEIYLNDITQPNSIGFLNFDAVAGSAPATPANLAWSTGGECEGTQASLSWDASSGATSYNVYRDGTSAGNIVYSGAATTFIDTGLTLVQAYAYRVSAVNGSGESALSSPLSITPCAVDCCDWGRTETPAASAWGKTENCTMAATARAGVPAVSGWARTETSCT
jgi:hypothetical protein